jgi:hypothetical protein
MIPLSSGIFAGFISLSDLIGLLVWVLLLTLVVYSSSIAGTPYYPCMLAYCLSVAWLLVYF